MAEAVANVARRINATLEEGRSSLDLSDCGLISFPDGVFKMLRSYTENIHNISLANNQIKSLNNKFFLTFRQLTELDLQGNSLTALPDGVGHMEHLTSINLSRNQLSVFPSSLTNLQQLQHINLQHNIITEVPLESLSVMASLQTVDVRSNPVTLQISSGPQNFTLLS